MGNKKSESRKPKEDIKKTFFIEKGKDARNQNIELNSDNNENIYSEGGNFTANDDTEFGEALNADDAEVNPKGLKIEATETIIIEFTGDETSEIILIWFFRIKNLIKNLRKKKSILRGKMKTGQKHQTRMLTLIL